MIDFQKQQKEIIEKMDLVCSEIYNLNKDLRNKLKNDMNAIVESNLEYTNSEEELTFLSLNNELVKFKLTDSEYKDLVEMLKTLETITKSIDELKSTNFRQKTINIIDKFYKG